MFKIVTSSSFQTSDQQIYIYPSCFKINKNASVLSMITYHHYAKAYAHIACNKLILFMQNIVSK